MRSVLDVLLEINSEVDFESEEDLVGRGILNSLDILSIVTVLEDEFDIEIPPTEINIDNFRSLNAIEELVKRISD